MGSWTARLRPFLIGGILGGIAGLAAGRLGTRRADASRPPAPPGLAAFERAPCFGESPARDERERPRHAG